MQMNWRILFLSCCLVVSQAAKGEATWQQTVAEARGQTVYFYAWGGSTEVNNYLRWAEREVEQRFDVTLVHVKVADIAEAVARILAEGEASSPAKSAIDLLWINGENFHRLKAAGQLLGDLPERIPAAQSIRADIPWQSDFGVPVEGFELPWGIGQFHLIARSEALRSFTDNGVIQPESLMTFAQENPGRMTYPKPPEFHGTTFLKSILVALYPNSTAFTQPPNASSRAKLAALWSYLDTLHPLLWRQGSDFPSSAAFQQQLLANGQLDISLSFNPQQLDVGQRQGRLPNGLQRLMIGEGAITNSHYLAIAKRSRSPQAAQVVIDFLLSAEAQTRKQAADGWGDPAVVNTVNDHDSGQLLAAAPELHIGWVELLESGWLERYQQ